MMLFVYIVVLFGLIPISTCEYCLKEDKYCSDNAQDRFFFYDINPPEGFNLRRDVYLRYAIFAHELHQSPNENLNKFKLVLPPWSHLYHWKRRSDAEQKPWATYFDLPSLQKFAPVIEMHEFFNSVKHKYSTVVIDNVYVLQHFEDMFRTGNFEDRMSIEECQQDIQTNFFFYTNVTSNNIKCLSFHGHTSQLTPLLEKSLSRTILFDHAEVALHDQFGNEIYWQARRSMRFNKELKTFATVFRANNLNSSDKSDNTFLPLDWRNEKPKRAAKGGPYLSVHLRRKDFVWNRSNHIPSITGAARQIIHHLGKLHLSTVFVATDASEEEFQQLVSAIGTKYAVLRYYPEKAVQERYGEGGVAIIDQIICSYAQFFTGTFESTFSFRIQEEREILGFPAEVTFNRLCGDKEDDCQKPSMWKIVF